VCGNLFYAKVPELGFWAALGQFFPFWASLQAQRLGAALRKRAARKVGLTFTLLITIF